MKRFFYPKLAWDGIRKNKRLYTPYMLTCIGMVMMHYIISFLATTPALAGIPGGDVISGMLELGSWIVALFAALFLFYSNSFLIRRRKREFGLYNILGMGKWSIGKILVWESVIIAALSLLMGLTAGIGLSKLFELCLVNLMVGTIDYSFTVSIGSILTTALVFAVIFALLFLNSLRQISLSNPITLLRSENAGEKPPKANWFLGIAGVVILAAAYYMAVTIEDPLTALALFFVAVALVIAATYLLFIAGSVVLCRILQKNKRYYYKASHFVSISSMTYRMKRNGAGLASICVLLTMVLVMLSSTSSLFIGAEDSLQARFPRDIILDMTFMEPEYATDEALDNYRAQYAEIFASYDVEPEDVQDYRTAGLAGLLTDGFFLIDTDSITNFDVQTYSDLVQLYFVPLADYNRMMNDHQTLDADEVLICSYRRDYTADTFQVEGQEVYRVKAVVTEFWGSASAAMSVIPTVYVVVPDFQAMIQPFANMTDAWGEDPLLRAGWHYSFNLDLLSEEEVSFFRELRQCVKTMSINDSAVIYNLSSDCLEAERDDFYGTYGGLFFLGIVLSIVFLAAAVLIIYYKQVSEGYEDQARFGIMRKVGMTKRDIRKSINSQMLTVFFLPLVTAGIHLCFAFPMIEKLLQLFNLWNTNLLIATTVVCFLIFGLFYTLVYRITSNAYYAIVSGAKED